MNLSSILPQRLMTAGSDRNIGRHTQVYAGGTITAGQIVSPDATTPTASNTVSVTKAAANDGKIINAPLWIACHGATSGQPLRVAEWYVLTGQNTSGMTVLGPAYLSDTGGGWSAATGTSKRRVGTILVAHASAGVVLLCPSQFSPISHDSYANTAASTAITGTQEADTPFDRNAVIKANRLKPGSRIRVRACGIHTATTGTETHTMALKIGTVAIASKASIDPANNDIFFFDFDIVVRTIGGSGTIVATGIMGFGASGSATINPVLLNSTTLDTTTDNNVSVWIDRQSTATDSDSARLDVISVDIID